MDRSGQPFRFSIGMPLDSLHLLLELCRRLKSCMMLLSVFTRLDTVDQSNLQANILTNAFSKLSPDNCLQQISGIQTHVSGPRLSESKKNHNSPMVYKSHYIGLYSL